jgi:hypothetical protein
MSASSPHRLHRRTSRRSRRPQTVRQYRPRVRDDAEIVIDVAGCLALLDRVHLDEVSRLLTLIALRHGADVMTLGEMKRQALRAVAEAGGIKAAIERLRARGERG